MNISERLRQGKLLLQIEKEITEDDICNAKFLLRQELKEDDLIHVQSWKQLIMLLEKRSERLQESSIVQVVRELLEALELDEVINKYHEMFGIPQGSQRSASSMLDTAQQPITDTAQQPTTHTDIEELVVAQPAGGEDDLSSIVLAVPHSDSQLEILNATRGCSVDNRTAQPTLHPATDLSAITNDLSHSHIQNLPGETSAQSSRASTSKDSSQADFSKPISSPDKQNIPPVNSLCRSSSSCIHTRRKSWPVNARLLGDEMDCGFENLHLHERSCNYRVQAELAQLLESHEIKFEQWWLAAEGPAYPLQTKYQALFRENLSKGLPELLAASGLIDGLQMFVNAYGSKALLHRHTKTWTPLDWAASSGQLQCVQWLIKHYDHIHLSHALLWAGQNGHMDVIKELIQGGANPRFRHPTGDSVLHFASRVGQITVIKFILHYFSEDLTSNFETFFGLYTPLHEAADCGQPNTVSELLKEGANVNAMSQLGETPMMLAVKGECRHDHRMCIRVLLQHGADVTITDNDNKTVFQHASANPACYLTLLQHGEIPNRKADIDIVDKFITLELVQSHRSEIARSVESRRLNCFTKFQPKIIPCEQMALLEKRQRAHHVLLELQQHLYKQHDLILMWTCGALQLLESYVIGQQADSVVKEAYMHLQLLYRNQLQQTENARTALLYTDQHSHFQFNA